MTSTSLASSVPFIVLFFSAMVGHELALEALATSYQRFPHMATSVTLFQFGFCVLLPLSLSLGGGGDVIKNFPRSPSDLWAYIKLSAVVYGATAFATKSLQYEGVTYVTKVVFKSAKLIPTMIVGVIFDRRAEKSGKIIQKRKYGFWQYTSAFMLCLGAAGFCMSPEDSEGGEEEEVDANDYGTDAMEQNIWAEAETFMKGQLNLGGHWIGIALLATSVFCDALVPNIQQQLMHGMTGNAPAPSLRKKDSEEEDIEMESLVKQASPRNRKAEMKKGGLSPQSLMVNTNSIGFTLLLVSTMFSSALLPILSFSLAHPHFALLHISVGLGLGTAVLAYTQLIKQSGPAVAVAAATLRKVVTVVLSYAIFPKPMTGVHGISAGLVTGGLLVGYIGKGT